MVSITVTLLSFFFDALFPTHRLSVVVLQGDARGLHSGINRWRSLSR